MRPQVFVRWFAPDVGAMNLLPENAPWGTRPVFVATVVRCEDQMLITNAAIPKSAPGEPPYEFDEEAWRAVCDHARNIGIKTILYDRYNSVDHRLIAIDTTTYRRVRPCPPVQPRLRRVA